jgi:hypothetical protein
MQKTSLKLYDFYELDLELSNLLSESIKMSTKYWLIDIAKKVATEKATCESIKQELVRKYGKEDEEGNFLMTRYINQTNEEGEVISSEINPKFVEFQNEFNSVLMEERELEHKEFNLSDFETVVSPNTYTTFYKLVRVQE